MTQLAWFPVDAEDWERLCDGLTLEEEGALFRATRKAWSDETPCTLPNTPGAWERLLGTRWRTLVRVVRRFFATEETDGTRVAWQWLRELWTLQLSLHQSAVAKGRKGGSAPTAPGKRRGRKPKPQNAPAISPAIESSAHRKTPAIPPAIANGRNRKSSSSADSRGVTPAAYAARGVTPANDVALAPDGAATPLAPGNGGRPSLRALAEAESTALAAALPEPPSRPPAVHRAEPITDAREISDPDVIAEREQRKAAFRRLSLATLEAPSPPAEEPSCAG